MLVGGNVVRGGTRVCVGGVCGGCIGILVQGAGRARGQRRGARGLVGASQEGGGRGGGGGGRAGASGTTDKIVKRGVPRCDAKNSVAEEFGRLGGGRAWHTLTCPAAAAPVTRKAMHSATSIHVSSRVRAPPRGWRPRHRQRLPPPSIANSSFGMLSGWCPAGSSLPPALPPARAAGDVMNRGYRRRAFNDAVICAPPSMQRGVPRRDTRRVSTFSGKSS